MRPDGVVVVLPDRQRLAHMGERGEERLVEQLVTQSSVEALDEGILVVREVEAISGLTSQT